MPGNKAVLPAILLAFTAALVLKLFCFDFILAEGLSMLPAIHNGSILIVNKLAFGFRPPFCGAYVLRWNIPKTGDVIVFLTPFDDLAVKRCAYITEDGRFFALGDNEPASFDSRSYGPVPVDNIIGKAFGIK
ncbi:MAG: S26 family signal peptidase [Spirochaetaceae bacterium]|jgi:signal peptidase I|nr:S26 family signal peptidase [Spirochaetaceae bacterium]